jgi:type I restriction enzyme R subunit
VSSQLQSANFGFLEDCDPLLVEYGLRAELNAYADSNTSLVKSRQFGELLARYTASRAGMECSDNKFDEILGLLRRHRLIPNEIYGYFTQVRLYGNAAVHEHERNQNAALQALICAHELAKWFVQSVLKTPDFSHARSNLCPSPRTLLES